MTQQYSLTIVIGLLSGLVGSFIGHKIFTTNVSPQGDVLNIRQLNIVDNKNRLRAQLGTNAQEGVGLWLMDTNGQYRSMLGIYPPGEGELPTLVLNDSSGNAAGLFRLVGANQVPYLILKNKGSDKAIMGLQEADAKPFLQGFSQ